MWSRRLKEVEAPTRCASELYAGDHWRSALEAYRLALRFSPRAELWIISAGYGLISLTKRIKPYGATFASRSSDSVWRGEADGGRRERLRLWWKRLGHEATLADLLPRQGDGALILALGREYLEALHDDLEQARKADGTRACISVISAGGRDTDCLLPVTAQLRPVVGGTNSALNARVLAWLAAEAVGHRFKHTSMAAVLERTTSLLPDHVPLSRGRSVSNEAIAFQIEQLLSHNPEISRTTALRLLRSSGVACKQDRFASHLAPNRGYHMTLAA